MFRMLKKKKIYPAFVSKDNSNHEKQVILLMISTGYCSLKAISIFKRNNF